MFNSGHISFNFPGNSDQREASNPNFNLQQFFASMAPKDSDDFATVVNPQLANLDITADTTFAGSIEPSNEVVEPHSPTVASQALRKLPFTETDTKVVDFAITNHPTKSVHKIEQPFVEDADSISMDLLAYTLRKHGFIAFKLSPPEIKECRDYTINLLKQGIQGINQPGSVPGLSAHTNDVFIDKYADEQPLTDLWITKDWQAPNQVPKPVSRFLNVLSQIHGANIKAQGEAAVFSIKDGKGERGTTWHVDGGWGRILLCPQGEGTVLQSDADGRLFQMDEGYMLFFYGNNDDKYSEAFSDEVDNKRKAIREVHIGPQQFTEGVLHRGVSAYGDRMATTWFVGPDGKNTT